MENIWEQFNKRLGEYFSDIMKRYELKLVRLDNISSALVGKGFALSFFIDRFSISINYIMRNEKQALVSLECESFFAERFDAADRKGLIPGGDVQATLHNELMIISRGLQSKWPVVLRGEKAWIKDYNKSMWSGMTAPRPVEAEKLSQYF